MPLIDRAVRAACLGTCVALSGFDGTAWGEERKPVVAAQESGKQPWSIEWLRDRDWFLPAAADPKPAAFTFAFPLLSDEFEFSQNPGRRVTWEVNVGKEIPIFVLENFTPATAVRGAWGVGLWTSISFHVLEEFEDPSAPIVNTDYRFSLATLKFRRVQRAFGRGPNHADYLDLKADLYHHESTHLGDEFVIGAQRKLGDAFERINVSYEFFDVGGSYEWRREAEAGGYARYMVRGGLVGVLPHSDGYYSDHTLEVDSRVIARSKRNLEPYVQAEYWTPHRETRRWALFASADARHKTIYDYHKGSDEDSEDKQWSFNALVGFRTESESTLSVKDVYARFYHGVNPHGQLRNQRDYTTFGVGVNFNIGQRR
jgi:hypothetical protein